MTRAYIAGYVVGLLIGLILGRFLAPRVETVIHYLRSTHDT